MAPLFLPSCQRDRRAFLFPIISPYFPQFLPIFLKIENIDNDNAPGDKRFCRA